MKTARILLALAIIALTTACKSDSITSPVPIGPQYNSGYLGSGH